MVPLVGAMGTCANAQSGFVHDPAKKNLHGGGGGGTDDDDVDDDDTGPREDGSMMGPLLDAKEKQQRGERDSTTMEDTNV